MDLKEVFDEVSNQMRSDFSKSQKSLTHSGLKGNANEEIVKSFLRQYLPKTLDITTGMVVDSEGNQSRQLDIIICDTAKTPIFYQSGEIRVIPIECVYAVIEVKAFLDKAELEKAHQNMLSIKSLNKKAYFKRNSIIQITHNLYEREWDFWPVNFFIFAFDSSSLESVMSNLKNHQTGSEIHKRIDSICILEKGVILNQHNNGMLSALPSKESRPIASLTSKPLLMFFAIISIILNQANMDPFNLMPYIEEMNF